MKKKFDKYMKIWENVSNVIKKINSELIYNEKYLKAEKKFITKERSQCFYVPVIFIDSVYIEKMKTIILKCF